MTNPYLECFIAGARPPDRRPVWQWLEDNVEIGNDSAAPGPFRILNAPHTKRIYELLADHSVREIIVACAAQTGKSVAGMCAVVWAMSEDPGPCMWHTDTDPNAEKFLRDRLLPMIHSCPSLASQITRQAKKQITFLNGPLYLSGTGSRGKVASDPIRWHFMDEVAKWGKGMLNRAIKRTASFWNAKRVMMSTPENEGDEFDQKWKDGTREYWFFPCENCGTTNQLLWGQMKWNTNDTTHPKDHWDWDELTKTIRFECKKCGHPHRDVPQTRWHICDKGGFVATNPKAPKWRVSLNWSALLPPLRPWIDSVREFLEANEVLKTTGNIEPMRVWQTETMGLPWEDRLGQIEDFGFLEHRKRDYDFGDNWSEEIKGCRFMSADRQGKGGEHYWYVVRAFGRFGKSRLIAYGKCATKAELETIRQEYGVSANKCLVDTGFETGDTYRFCASFGWHAFKGDDAPYFLMVDPATKRAIRKLWKLSFVDPAVGTSQQGRLRPIELIRFSSDGLKDVLIDYMRGTVGEWTLPERVGRDYMLQMTAEVRKERLSKRGKIVNEWHRIRPDNHLLDCELQIMVAAMICKVVYSVNEVKPVEEETAESN